jgi:hypothetical protein
MPRQDVPAIVGRPDDMGRFPKTAPEIFFPLYGGGDLGNAWQHEQGGHQKKIVVQPHIRAFGFAMTKLGIFFQNPKYILCIKTAFFLLSYFFVCLSVQPENQILMKKTILLLAMAISCTGLLAQPRIQHIGTDSEFVQHSVAKYSTDEYVVAGTITSGAVSGSSDILVLMTDHAGNVLWEKYVDYGMDEFVGTVIVDSKKNIVLTGYTGTNNTGNKDLIVVALDGNGNYVNDIVIQDGGMNGYGLYGFDIVETNGDQMEYLVVGTGVDNATMASNKYAFVLKYIPDSGVQWGRIYQSTGLGVTTNFDSFNHILKVDDHPLYGEVYLLTGSGMDDLNFKQMVTNDLIDPYNNGLSVWNLANAQGHREPDLAFNNFGVMSVYKQSTNKFYVMYYGMENVPSIMEMDGNTGSGSNLVSFYPW